MKDLLFMLKKQTQLLNSMNRQNVIVVIAPTLEVWGNFKKLCEAKGFDILPYHSLKSKPFPILYNDKLINFNIHTHNGKSN